MEVKPKENQEKIISMPEKQKHSFNQPNRKGRPTRQTKSRGEIDDLLMSWRKGGEAGERAAQTLWEKYKIRAVLPAITPREKEEL